MVLISGTVSLSVSTDGTAHVVRRELDASGRVRGRVFPDGNRVGDGAELAMSWRYDGVGRLLSIPG